VLRLTPDRPDVQIATTPGPVVPHGGAGAIKQPARSRERIDLLGLAQMLSPTAAASALVSAPGPASSSADAMSWIQVAEAAPYFVTERGEAWTPVGHNEAVTWPELAGLFRRRDMAGVEAHLRRMRQLGVTVLRLMLEYAQGDNRYLNGLWACSSQAWCDSGMTCSLCERVGMRVLLTPFDTFFTWLRWDRHPYNRQNGGPCDSRTRLLVCPETRAAIKRRLAFATERWGHQWRPLFAWLLWNEFHPAHADHNVQACHEIISDLSRSLRAAEISRYGRAHPQTVAVFGPELLVGRPSLTPCCATPSSTSPRPTSTSRARSTIPATPSRPR